MKITMTAQLGCEIVFNSHQSPDIDLEANLRSSIDPSKPSRSQQGKVIIITGATKGIGRNGFVASFAKAGANGLVLIARSKSILDEIEVEIKALYPNVKVLIIPTNITDEKSVATVFELVKQNFGTVDVLVNNAGTLSRGTIKDSFWGGFYPHRSPLLALSSWERQIRGRDVNKKESLRLIILLNLGAANQKARVRNAHRVNQSRTQRHTAQASSARLIRSIQEPQIAMLLRFIIL
ncbi:hypothetical protein F5884DRAFT_825687 [Xylogone sp. PMI_703]|nr:hypothetical protein F5884DRAFT_825687 [Xylogone sp. PMI_703]